MIVCMYSMSHEHLVKWGKDAFEKGFSLYNIENYLLKRGLKQHEAVKALHEITAFENKIHREIKDLRKILISVLILFLLILSGLIFLYLISKPIQTATFK